VLAGPGADLSVTRVRRRVAALRYAYGQRVTRRRTVADLTTSRHIDTAAEEAGAGYSRYV